MAKVLPLGDHKSMGGMEDSVHLQQHLGLPRSLAANGPGGSSLRTHGGASQDKLE